MGHQSDMEYMEVDLGSWPKFKGHAMTWYGYLKGFRVLVTETALTQGHHLKAVAEMIIAQQHVSQDRVQQDVDGLARSSA